MKTVRDASIGSSLFLEQVAQHEQELQLVLQQARQEAETLLASAHAESRALEKSEEAKLVAKLAELRQEVDVACNDQWREVTETARAELSKKREAVTALFPQAVQAVIKQVLPANTSSGTPIP